MNLISRQTDYATKAIVHIAKARGSIVSSAELYATLGIPRPFLRKILQILQKENVLQSTKGNQGGFSLGLPANKIFLVDLMRIFKNQLSFAECRLCKKVCPDIARCPIRKTILEIEKAALKKLKPVTIAGLLKGKFHEKKDYKN